VLSLIGISGESPADTSLRKKHTMPALSNMFLRRGISPIIGELNFFFIACKIGLTKKAEPRRPNCQPRSGTGAATHVACSDLLSQRLKIILILLDTQCHSTPPLPIVVHWDESTPFSQWLPRSSPLPAQQA
jgi:hypothetical protein